MRKAYYLKTRKPTFDDQRKVFLDKIGGLPTHKPIAFPMYYENVPYGFVMQIYNDKNRFPEIKDVLCWHIYQDIYEEDEPIIVEVPIGADLNTDNDGTPIERLTERIIFYETGLEPDILEFDSAILNNKERFHSSKIGGAIPRNYSNNSNIVFIGWIGENFCEENNLNFGGYLDLIMVGGKIQLKLV